MQKDTEDKAKNEGYLKKNSAFNIIFFTSLEDKLNVLMSTWLP